MTSDTRQKITPLQYPDWPTDLKAVWDKAAQKADLSPSAYNRMQKALSKVFGILRPGKPDPDDVCILPNHFEAAYTPSSAVTYLYDLYSGLALMWPSEDWQGLHTHIIEKRKALWAEQGYTPQNWRQRSSNCPAERRALPIKDWPKEPRDIWYRIKQGEGGKVSRRLKSQVSPLGRQSDAYKARIERGLSHWFLAARKNDWPDLPTEETAERWIEAEQAHGSSPISIGSYAFELWRGMSLIYPDLEWRWLSEIADSVEADAAPSRPKLTSQVTTASLRALGQKLMAEAFAKAPTERNIIQFRDGLMILLLTEKPMRLKNLASLTLDDLNFDECDGVSLSVGITKNKSEDFAYLSPELIEALTVWITDLRPRLAPHDDDRALWIGRFGQQATAKHISRQIARKTKAAFGVSVSPHKFRNAVARTLAHHAPENVAVASRLLGHKSRQSIAPYEGLARTAGAASVLDSILADYTMPPPIRRRHK